MYVKVHHATTWMIAATNARMHVLRRSIVKMTARIITTAVVAKVVKTAMIPAIPGISVLAIVRVVLDDVEGLCVRVNV